jgi:hypothetical protein
MQHFLNDCKEDKITFFQEATSKDSKDSVEKESNTTMDIVNIDPQGADSFNPNRTLLKFEVKIYFK